MIEYFSKLIPDVLKPLSGAVFYSGKAAFSDVKKLYILGLNPGGDEVTQKEDTIETHTKMVLEKKPSHWSEYSNEVWRVGSEPGTTSMQPRVTHLIENLGLDINDVPASNVCFVRSRNEKGISAEFIQYADLCWDFHQQVIKNLEVKMVLCFGKTAGHYVKSKIGANKKIDEFIEQNERRWKTEIFQNEEGLIVVIATHPSRVAWQNETSDPSPLIKKYLES